MYLPFEQLHYLLNEFLHHCRSLIAFHMWVLFLSLLLVSSGRAHGNTSIHSENVYYYQTILFPSHLFSSIKSIQICWNGNSGFGNCPLLGLKLPCGLCWVHIVHSNKTFMHSKYFVYDIDYPSDVW